VHICIVVYAGLIMHTKICAKCGVEQGLGGFSIDRSRKDMLYPICRCCESKRKKKYHRNNKEKTAKRCKRYRENNKEKTSKRSKEYYENNREKEAKRNKKYYENNKDKVAKRVKEYLKNHPEKNRMRNRKRRAMEKEVSEIYTALDEAYTKDLFSHKCYNCGSKDNPHIDHHCSLSSGNALTRTNAVLLCKPCNSSKGAKLPSQFYSPDKLKKLEAMLYP